MTREAQVLRDGQWITLDAWDLRIHIEHEPELRTEHGVPIAPPWRVLDGSRVIAAATYL